MAAVLFGIATPASAQTPLLGRDGEITPYPICSHLINRSTVTMYGSLETMPQDIDGKSVHQDSNFKLAPGEKREFCASGPFYAGQKLELTIRTLIPMFSCKTGIAKDIYLDMQEDDDGTKTYSATCQ